MFFVVFLDGESGGAADRVFEDRRVRAGFGREAGGGVDDRVEDQFDQDTAADRDTGGSPGVVDALVVFEYAAASFFEEFAFTAETADRRVGRRRGGRGAGQVPDDRRAGGPHVAAAAKEGVFQADLDRQDQADTFFSGDAEFADRNRGGRFGQFQRRVETGEPVFEGEFTGEAQERFFDFFAVDQAGEAAGHGLGGFGERDAVGRFEHFGHFGHFVDRAGAALQGDRVDDRHFLGAEHHFARFGHRVDALAHFGVFVGALGEAGEGARQFGLSARAHRQDGERGDQECHYGPPLAVRSHISLSVALLALWFVWKKSCVRSTTGVGGGEQADVAGDVKHLPAQLARVEAGLGRERPRQRVDREDVDFRALGADFIAPFAEAVGAHHRALGQLAGFDPAQPRVKARNGQVDEEFPRDRLDVHRVEDQFGTAGGNAAPAEVGPLALAVAGVGGGEGDGAAGARRQRGAREGHVGNGEIGDLGRSRRLLGRPLRLGDSGAVLLGGLGVALAHRHARLLGRGGPHLPPGLAGRGGPLFLTPGLPGRGAAVPGRGGGGARRARALGGVAPAAGEQEPRQHERQAKPGARALGE